MDAFTAEGQLFTGNPAAVCLIRGTALQDKTMQAIAAEMNLSETAFVRAENDDQTLECASQFHLRWFTPTCEVPLCGHATLSAAAVLFNSLKNPSPELYFRTASGVLKAARRGGSVSLDFPQNPCVREDTAGLEELVQLVIGETPLRDLQYSASTKKLLIRLDDAVDVGVLKQLQPNAAAMVHAHSGKVRGVIVTLIGSGKYDFFSRYFAPWVGIPEDPVTGSAHTVLAPYWGHQLQKTSMWAFQCSPRGGEMEVTLDSQGRVHLVGTASVLLEGKMNIPLCGVP